MKVIIRKIDDAGRFILPKDIRYTLGLKTYYRTLRTYY